jgi:16S rRNA (uracil1498-N3)-methyltransferase
MPARRFFVPDAHRIGDAVEIDAADARKIVTVLRLRDGDAIEVIDSTATLYDASIGIDGSRVTATLERERSRAHESAVCIDVAQAIPKGQKMDFVVEKLTELGARAILPLISERTLARAPGDAKLDRWRRLARTAAQQCGRASIPAVAEPLDFAALLERFPAYDAVLFPWELADGADAREALPRAIAGAGTILVVIGPEGGFSHEEAAAAQAAGAIELSLGSRILRTETAGLALLAILGFLTVR